MRRMSTRLGLALALSLLAHVSAALPGAYPAAVSTFDTRASSVVLAYRAGLVGPVSRQFSYNANFTSTTGNFSAQFGAHYLQLHQEEHDVLLHGAAASGSGVFNLPLTQRFANGVPMVALNLYGGGVPTAAVGGTYNFLTFPLTLGVGTSLSPTPWLTFTPWYEVAPGANLTTLIREVDYTSLGPDDIPQNVDDPQQQDGIGTPSNDDIAVAVRESVVTEFSIQVGMRVGLTSTVRVSERVSLNVFATLGSLGAAFGGRRVFNSGAGLVVHWDDVVTALKPASQRLADESCEDVEARFRTCPAAKHLLRPAPHSIQSTFPAYEPVTPRPAPTAPVDPSASPALAPGTAAP